MISTNLPGLDRPRTPRETEHLRRLEALDMRPVGICLDCRDVIVSGTAETPDEAAVAFHQSEDGLCDARIAARLVAAHVKAGRLDAAVATMRYLHLKIEAATRTAGERHDLRDRITADVPSFEKATWPLVYNLFGSPYETEAEAEEFE